MFEHRTNVFSETHGVSDPHKCNVCLFTYRLTAYPHLAVGAGAALRWHLQLDAELALRQNDVGRHLAALQIDCDSRGAAVGARIFATLVQVQVQVAVRKEVALVSLQRKLFRSEKFLGRKQKTLMDSLTKKKHKNTHFR